MNISLNLSPGQKTSRRFHSITEDVLFSLDKYHHGQEGIIKIQNQTADEHILSVDGFMQKGYPHPVPISSGAHLELRFFVMQKTVCWSYSFFKQIVGYYYDTSQWNLSTDGWTTLENRVNSIVNSKFRITQQVSTNIIYTFRSVNDLPYQGVWRFEATIYNTTDQDAEAYVVVTETNVGVIIGEKTLIAPGENATVYTDVELRNELNIQVQPRLECPSASFDNEYFSAGDYMEADNFSLYLISY